MFVVAAMRVFGNLKDTKLTWAVLAFGFFLIFTLISLVNFFVMKKSQTENFF